MVPAQCAVELRSDLVLPFHIIREGVDIADSWYLKTHFIKLGPKLQVMQLKANILRHEQLAIVADIATGR